MSQFIFRHGVNPIAALLLLAGSPAVQSAESADRNLVDLPFDDLLEITIESAGKRPEQIRDIPASVTILTREEISRYGYVTLEELIRNTPGFYMLDNIEDRFIGNRGTVGGGIQFLVNGVPQHPSRQRGLTIPEIARLNIPVESIDRIEVIRGPMSVIYGNNAFLGVINVVTNTIGEYGPRTSASLGSRNSGRLFARVGSETNKGYFVINAGGYRTDGLDGAYADMMGPEQLGGLQPGMHRSLDGYADQEDLSLDMSAGWGEWSANLRYTEKDYGIYAFTPGFEDGSRERITTWHATLGWERAITESLGVRANAIYSEERADAYQLDFLFPELEGDQKQVGRRWEGELDLLWDPKPNLSLVAGYRYRLIDDIENRYEILPLVHGWDRVESHATHDLFVDLGWNATDRLRFTGGLRLSRLPASYHFTRLDYLGDLEIEREVSVEDRNLVTGRVAAIWDLDAHQVVKLIWGTAAQDNDELSSPKPEYIETAELNYVQTYPGWTLSASLFHNITSNIIRKIQYVDQKTGLYQTRTDNTGEWETTGLEFIGQVSPVTGLNLAVSATWQQTEDRNTAIEPGYSPDLLVKLQADYTSGPMTYAAYAHYVDDMEADWNFVEAPTPGETQRIGDPVDAYWSLGANLRYRHPGSGFYANLNVSNLLDEEIRYPAYELTDFQRGLIGPGRVITATIGYEF